MKNNQKVIIASVGLIIIGMYYFYKQGKQDATTAQEPTKSNNNANTPPAKADWDKVLKKGDTGQEVGILQTALKQLKVDNSFGDKTEQRLKNVMKVTETSLNNYNKFITKK